MTLGSLFDGIAGFPLAASKAGIVTLWADMAWCQERELRLPPG